MAVDVLEGLLEEDDEVVQVSMRHKQTVFKSIHNYFQSCISIKLICLFFFFVMVYYLVSLEDLFTCIL